VYVGEGVALRLNACREGKKDKGKKGARAGLSEGLVIAYSPIVLRLLTFACPFRGPVQAGVGQ